MNRDLEELILALDAAMQAKPDELDELRRIYFERIDGYVARNPNVKRETVEKILQSYYPKWSRAQNRPPTIPPRA